MRIAVWHNLLSGGGKRALYEHVKGLVSGGHAVAAWCPSIADTEYLPLRTLVPETVLTLEKPRLPSALRGILRAARASEKPFERMLAMRAHAEQFAQIVTSDQFDVAFVNSCWWFYTPFVGRHLRVPSVAYLGEPYRRFYEASPELPWIAEADSVHEWWHPLALRHWLASAIRLHADRVQAREELANIRTLDRILVNSQFSRESMMRAFNVNAHICHLGIDSSRFANNPGEREPFVLSVGEFIPNKRPTFIIRAIASTQKRPALVWIANRVDEEYLREAKQLAVDLGVTLQIKAKISELELVRHYQSTSVFVYAPRLEPFGLAPLEASCCGAPVVAVGEAGVRETVADTKTGIVVGYDAQQMGAAIDILLSDSSLARVLGQNGAACVRQAWTTEAATDRLEGHLLAVAHVQHSKPEH